MRIYLITSVRLTSQPIGEEEVKKDSMSGKDKGRGRRVCQGEIREEGGEHVREG